MTKNRDVEDQQLAAHEVTTEWVSLVTAVALTLDPATSSPVNRALKDAILSLDRSLILFLCGGEGGHRDGRDIQPADFLGHDWYPTDDEMDQRLRGRLGAISKLRAHLTWHRATSNEAVIWPLGLLAWETSWTMGEFIAELRSVRVAILTGAGTAFSSGGNVKHMRDKIGMFGGTPAQLRQGHATVSSASRRRSTTARSQSLRRSTDLLRGDGRTLASLQLA